MSEEIAEADANLRIIAELRGALDVAIGENEQRMVVERQLQADAAALYQLLDDAITLCHIPEHNQDAQWYARFEAIILAFHEEHPGAALLTELDTLRQQAERAETARQAWMVIGSRADGVIDAVRAYLSRETSCLPIEKADTDALGWLVNALAFYDAATKARSE